MVLKERWLWDKRKAFLIKPSHCTIQRARGSPGSCLVRSQTNGNLPQYFQQWLAAALRGFPHEFFPIYWRSRIELGDFNTRGSGCKFLAPLRPPLCSGSTEQRSSDRHRCQWSLKSVAAFRSLQESVSGGQIRLNCIAFMPVGLGVLLAEKGWGRRGQKGFQRIRIFP